MIGGAIDQVLEAQAITKQQSQAALIAIATGRFHSAEWCGVPEALLELISKVVSLI